MSQTAMLSGGSSSAATAPSQASAPSSSAESTRARTPAAWESSSANSSPLALCRPGEVTTISTRSHPSRRARRVWARAISAASAHLGAVM